MSRCRCESVSPLVRPPSAAFSRLKLAFDRRSNAGVPRRRPLRCSKVEDGEVQWEAVDVFRHHQSPAALTTTLRSSATMAYNVCQSSTSTYRTRMRSDSQTLFHEPSSLRARRAIGAVMPHSESMLEDCSMSISRTVAKWRLP